MTSRRRNGHSGPYSRESGLNSDGSHTTPRHPSARYSSSAANNTDQDFSTASYRETDDMDHSTSSHRQSRTMPGPGRRYQSGYSGDPSSTASSHSLSRSGKRHSRTTTGTDSTLSDNSSRSNDWHNQRSDDASSYTSGESYDTDDTEHGRRRSHRKSRDTHHSSDYSGRYYPDPMDNDEMRRLQSGYSQDTSTGTDTTLTNGDDQQNDIDELANYFNRRLEDMQKQTSRSSASRGYSQRDNYPDDVTSTYSYNNQNRTESSDRPSNYNNRTIRPTNRAISSTSEMTPTNSRSVYNAVNSVQSQVGQVRDQVDGSMRRRRGNDWESREEESYDSSDSGIGPRNLTIRPLTRAHANAMAERQASYPKGASYRTDVQTPVFEPPMSHMDDDDNYLGSNMPSHPESNMTPSPPPPEPISKSLKSDMVNDDMPIPFQTNFDEEEEWDDFEEFIDDDTPAPEASIPVPKVGFKTNNYAYQAVYITYILSFLAYVYVRITYTLDAPGLNRVYCIVVASLEIVTAPSLLLQGLCLWRWISRNPPPGNAFERPKFHTCRIMVPTYKEPLEVVAGTIHEIIHMELPPGLHVHVYVLDDGKRENLENWVLSKRTKRGMYLHYIARPKLPGIPHHAKAGNINHTLHFIFDDAQTEGECVAIFDADFMPRRNYLMQVLPVFSEKRTRPLGLVQTPQFFYNVNPDEDVWDHLNVSFFHRIEPSLDRWSAVNCCGTNFIVRADALKDVGYFPVGCLTEDTLLSLRLCTMGWGVAYHHEVLAIGQSPHEITEIFKQRSRWCKGNLQIFLDEFPLMQSGLSLSQRLFYSSCGFNYFCASISIPFFQLVPAWAIFFGLWPVSKIGLEFAFAFFIYYILGNILLLFPPPRFGVKDMWNGELASTNLWFTYFNGVRRIVGTKILKGKGELTFKTTKKKAEGEDELSKVGFRKEDVRACYMHFIMFTIMLVTIIYAIVKAIIAEDVKFYFYYMYMIGMSWAMINMVPYLIVVIYCWYRVRIPGLMVACFRNIQLLLRIVCAALILVQAFTTRNLTENFICGHEYEATLGLSQLTMVTTLDEASGLDVERNAFWLLGLDDDFYTMQQVKRSACDDATVPVIVFFMHPSQGLVLEVEAGHYMPEERIGTWEEYDEKLDYYAEHLSEIPSIIVMEPSLLMHTFNSKTEYHNTEYQLAYAARVEQVINKFPNSWVYVDAGNAMYLQWTVNLEHIISVLKKMPANVRGFSVNVGSFVNSTFNRQLAEEIHCQTGLHYIVDTSRNGGSFSRRSIEEINECTYDPPMVEKGDTPSWQTGAALRQHQAQQLANTITIEEPEIAVAIEDELEDDSTNYDIDIIGKRKKRWSLDGTNDGNAPVYAYDNEAAGGVNPGGGGGAGGGGGGGGKRAGGGGAGKGGGGGGAEDYGDPGFGDYDGDYYYPGGDVKAKSCITPEGQEGLDAFAWVKTPGESDGRMFTAGTFHPCLLGHIIECTDTCPQYVPKLSGEFQRSDSCKCIDD
uniref:uncharacterized protein LOC120345683 isoform X3 n=1 Tax=Styela clava TaxID=7725 RepID=UPI0019398C8C|nr:uncharacterized protein LOC120345683 isoform X3 [Styela clava]